MEDNKIIEEVNEGIVSDLCEDVVSGSNNGGVIAGIVAGIVAAGVAGVIIYIKKKKGKLCNIKLNKKKGDFEVKDEKNDEIKEVQ